eukprot:194359_1
MPKHKETDLPRKWMKEYAVWHLDLCKMLEREDVKTLSDFKSLNKDTVLDLINKTEETGFIHSSKLKKLHGGFKISLELKICYILSYWLRSEIITTKTQKHNYSFLFAEAYVKIISKFTFGEPQYYQFIENIFKMCETLEPIKGVEYQYSCNYNHSEGSNHIEWTLQLFLKDNKCYYSYKKSIEEWYVSRSTKQRLNGYGKWDMKNEDALLVNIQLSNQSDTEFKKNGSMYEKMFEVEELISHHPDWIIDRYNHRKSKLFQYIYE